MQPFTRRVIEIIQSIPPGKVMTYGQIAAEAGSPRGARQVVRILHSQSRAHNLPWHRVVNSQGAIALQEDEHRFLQITSLREEGVEVSEDGCVELEEYRYLSEPKL
ncbi:MGMT family protein [Paenibacillus koleovorans]|uniref:MGMT family protein n=1 Tax=Paenibacillus koleovorans TaxID=121608 RepID=UPI000FDCD5D7|nr:MGMT family protein [Paenibacillus koleovorans]